MKKFYGYKKCSTSRKAQKYLDEHHVQYEFQDLVAQPPTQAELVQWLSTHQDRGLKYFFNTHGVDYRRQNLKEQLPTMSIAQAAALMAHNGKLIKRPLMVEGDHLTCGFDEATYQKNWLN